MTTVVADAITRTTRTTIATVPPIMAMEKETTEVSSATWKIISDTKNLLQMAVHNYCSKYRSGSKSIICMIGYDIQVQSPSTLKMMTCWEKILAVLTAKIGMGNYIL